MESSGNKRKICDEKEEDEHEDEELNVERFCELLKNISDSDNYWMNSSSSDIRKAADLSSADPKKTKKNRAKEDERNTAWIFLPEDFTEDDHRKLHPCKVPSAETPRIEDGVIEVTETDEKLDLSLSL